MKNEFPILKVIHLGSYFENELRKRKQTKGSCVRSIGEYPQIISDLRLSPRISLKQDIALGKEEVFFLSLQA